MGFENVTPGTTKVVFAGSSVPNSSYSVVGRLALAPGSYVVGAKADFSHAGTVPVGLECFLTAPNTAPDRAITTLLNQKGANVRALTFELTANLSGSGNVDLRCHGIGLAADRVITAQDVRIVATSVNSIASTRNPAPPFGS